MRNFNFSLFSYSDRGSIVKYDPNTGNWINIQPSLNKANNNDLQGKIEAVKIILDKGDMSTPDYFKVKEMLAEIKNGNEAETQRILSVLNDAYKSTSAEGKKRDIQIFIDKFKADHKQLQDKYAVTKEATINATWKEAKGVKETTTLDSRKKVREERVQKAEDNKNLFDKMFGEDKKPLREAENFNESNHLDYLANLDRDDQISQETRDLVGEQDLKRALSHASAGGKNLDQVYERVTGNKNPDWSNPDATAQIFHGALRTSMGVIRQLTGNGNAGLVALLEGKTGEFIKNVNERVQKNGGKALEVKTMEDSGTMAPWLYNVLGALVTAGVAYGTEGIAMVGSEKNNVEAEEFMREFKNEKEGGSFGDNTAKVLSWIKDAFMGRELSWRFAGEKRVEKFRKQVSDYTKGVMELTKDTKPETITDPKLKTAFATASNTLRKAKGMDEKMPLSDADMEKIQKALIQSYILDAGNEKQGSNYSGSIGILMLAGIHKDTVAVETAGTLPGEHNAAEKEVTATSVDKKIYEQARIKIEKTKDGNWSYTVPREIKLEGDEKPYPVNPVIPLEEVAGGYVYISQEPQKVNLTNDGEKYDLTFEKSSASSLEPQKPQDVLKIRNRPENLASKSFAEKLFAIGHSKNRNWQKLTTLLSSQDFEGAKALLVKMSEKKGPSGKVAQSLLSDSTPMNTWTSYMYGSSASRSKEVFSQKYADKAIRTGATVQAENRLAKKLGMALPPSDEAEFRVKAGEKFEAKQASDVYQGQEMTIACFATPKGGAHRLDTYDGSVTVNKPKTITNTSEKLSIIQGISDHTAKTAGVEQQLNKLNEFIRANKGQDVSVVSKENYIKYLAYGDINMLGVPGLELQTGKEPKVFEGRAMIAGNVCLNRLYGIVYPAFTLNKVSQEVTTAMSVPLNDLSVETTQSVAGWNTIGIAAAAINAANAVPSSIPTPPTGSMQSVTDTTVAGGTPGWSVTNVVDAVGAWF